MALCRTSGMTKAERHVYLQAPISRRAENRTRPTLVRGGNASKIQTLRVVSGPTSPAFQTARIQPRLRHTAPPACGPACGAQVAAKPPRVVDTSGQSTCAAAIQPPLPTTSRRAHAARLQCDASPDDGAPQLATTTVRRLYLAGHSQDLTPAPDLTTPAAVAPQPPGTPEFSWGWEAETARHIGTVVHAASEQFARKQLQSNTAIEAQRGFYEYQLRRHGVPATELHRAASVDSRSAGENRQQRPGSWIFARRAPRITKANGA